MTLVYTNFARFGLEMHIGRNGGKSKTECAFFPPPQFFQHRQLPTIRDDRRQTRSMTTRTSQSLHLDVAMPDDDEDNEDRTECEGAIYDKLDETRDIDVEDGYVTFTRSFRYLGSMISFNLRDNEDITAQVAAATASMGALKEVWRNQHLDI